MGTTCESPHHAPVHCWEDLVDRFGDWRVARQLSLAAVDDLAGLTLGHTEKILGPSRAKGLTQMTFDLFLPTLGLQLLLVEDPDAAASIAARWERRDERAVRQSQRVSRKLLDRARPVIIQELIEAAEAARPTHHKRCA